MIRRSIKQYGIVRSDSASIFEEQLNARIREIDAINPNVKIMDNGTNLTAVIEYTDVYEKEEEKKELRETGIKLKCAQCPYYEPLRKKDGTVDARSRLGDCPYAEVGRTYGHFDACNVLYRMIMNGGIKLCLTDSE
jgi:hypothetical protein